MNDKQFTEQRALLPFLKRIFHYALRYPRWMAYFLFWIIVVSICDAAFPLVLIEMIDGAITPELQRIADLNAQGLPYTLQWGGVVFYLLVFAAIGALQLLGIYIFVKYAGRVQEHVMHDLRQAMFARLQRLSFSYYDKNASGWLLTRLVSDADRVAELISWGMVGVIWGISMILFCIIVMFIYHWQMGLIVALSLPIMFFASVKIRMLVLHYSRQTRRINSELTAAYNEHINGVAINKSTAQERRVGREFDELTERMRSNSYRASFYTALYMPVVIIIGSLAAAAVVFFGGKMAIALPAGITVGVLIASFDYATKIFMPITDISMFYATAQSSLSAGERIFSLIDEEITIKDADDATDFGRIRGDIEFKNVDFHYIKEQPVMKQFNLKIPAGQTIALVGATGEGKTSIANLVARFYEISAGQILIDGEDIQKKTLGSLRSQMGIVLQSPHLFAGTIRHNICYGKPDATDAEVLEALKLVGAMEFATRLDEQVGEEGGQLSLGERQLISFARAVLINPAILVMDEATASIDTLTEARIQQSMERILEGRTALVIAHRLSTIKNADRILVIQRGEIVEDGSHEELMRKKGKYCELYTGKLLAV